MSVQVQQPAVVTSTVHNRRTSSSENAAALVPTVEEWGATRFKVMNYSYTWTIHDFSFCPLQTGGYLRSSEFPAGRIDCKYKWYLKLFPRGEDNKDYLSLYLHQVHVDNIIPETKVPLKATLCVVNSKGEKISSRCREAVLVFLKQDQVFWGDRYYLSRDYVLNKANNVLNDDKLTIFCEIGVSSDVILNIPGNMPVVVPECNLVQDLGHMLESEKFADVTLCLGSQEIKAHKNILAARSPVFDKMFEHNMKESQENRVEIKDVDIEAFKEMLHYIYTGQSPNIEKMAVELLETADRFGLERLKGLCEQILCANLSLDNAAGILVLATFHSASQIRVHAIQYIVANLTSVMNTDGWKSLINNPAHMGTVVEILEANAKSTDRLSTFSGN